MKIIIPIAPQSKQRPRTGRGKVYTAAKTRRYESSIRQYTAQFDRLDGRLSLDATFVFSRPKRMPKRLAARQPRSGTPDVDNLLKALCDGLQGSVISNDSAFIEMTGRKVYAALDEAACIEVVITEYDSKRSALHARALSPPKERILEALAQGVTCKQAAQMSSVAESTFYRWKRDDLDFAERVDMALSKAQAKVYTELLDSIERAQDWRGYAWILERRFPQSWGANRRLNVELNHNQNGIDKIQQAIAKFREHEKVSNR